MHDEGRGQGTPAPSGARPARLLARCSWPETWAASSAPAGHGRPSAPGLFLAGAAPPLQPQTCRGHRRSRSSPSRARRSGAGGAPAAPGRGPGPAAPTPRPEPRACGLPARPRSAGGGLRSPLASLPGVSAPRPREPAPRRTPEGAEEKPARARIKLPAARGRGASSRGERRGRESLQATPRRTPAPFRGQARGASGAAWAPPPTRRGPEVGVCSDRPPGEAAAGQG